MLPGGGLGSLADKDACRTGAADVCALAIHSRLMPRRDWPSARVYRAEQPRHQLYSLVKSTCFLFGRGWAWPRRARAAHGMPRVSCTTRAPSTSLTKQFAMPTTEARLLLLLVSCPFIDSVCYDLVVSRMYRSVLFRLADACW